jgi:NADPH:quinone reductase
MKAVRVHTPGGPEALVYEDLPDPRAGPGQTVVRIEAAGLNFTEVYTRKGANPAAMPTLMGVEGAGTVADAGPDVTEFKPGDRVAFYGVPGAYAEMALVPAARLIKLPDSVSTKQAAASLLQGMTAHYLAYDTFPLRTGQTCLVHAAAGGVGLLLCQIAHGRGARVIGTVSTDAKAKAAREAGADEIILYTQVDFEEEVKRLTEGRGLDVVYDSVGQTTFLKGFNCLRPRGMMVLYGMSSGQPDPVDTGLLAQKGSVFLTRATLASYTLTRDELVARSGEVFSWVGSGKLKVRIHAEFALKDVAKAHAALEHRETVGKVLLIP